MTNKLVETKKVKKKRSNLNLKISLTSQHEQCKHQEQ